MERRPQPEELEAELEPDPRESPFELPPIDGAPFANENAKAEAICRIVEQAEHERASTS
jgi:hypothetical protein